MQSPKQVQPLSPLQQHGQDEQKRFKASGLTAHKFCQLHQLNPSIFYKRRERLAELSVNNIDVPSQHVC